MIRYFWGRLLGAFTVLVALVALVVALLADAPLAAVQPGPPGGQWTATWSTAMVAFFGCLYFAAMRPEEAVALNKRHLALPEKGWGESHLDGAEPHPGKEWTVRLRSVVEFLGGWVVSAYELQKLHRRVWTNADLDASAARPAGALIPAGPPR
jgi:hypothetical protein